MFPLKISVIANLIKGQLNISADLFINKLNRIENSIEGDLTFYSDERFKKQFDECNASCIIVNENHIITDNRNYIVVPNAYLAFISIINLINQNNSTNKTGISKTSVIGENCQISNLAFIGHNVVIGNNCIILDNTQIHSNCSIADNVKIGNSNIIYPNVSIYSNTIIGDNCIIQSGAVIGSDGFGFVEDKSNGSFTKIPHIGNVVIKNNVEIGANTTIDRSLVGSTLIENGVIIDNLVQIGHNCVIGENTAIAGQAGVAGSCKIGKRVRIGGQVALAGHLELGDDISIIGKSGVSKSIKDKGVYFGTPAKPQRDAFRIEAISRNLPELANDIKQIKKLLNVKF
jgi:UDP-3-O-[3-hydroxymyristoyl] glucosamine N-acyltransferase